MSHPGDSLDRRQLLRLSAAALGVASASTVVPAALAADAVAPDPRRLRLFNAADYGAKLDGKTDDAPAIMAAFNAMKIDGKPFGTLLIPGVARIASTLDFDGGYRNTPAESGWSAGRGEDLRILVAGALRPDPNIAVAVHLHGARCVWADFRFDRGGSENDVALLLEDLDFVDIGVTGTDFAGTLLKADATADITKRIRSSKIHRVYAGNCGQAIHWAGIEAFGSFEMVWDRNCTRGSLFKQCADTGIKHYENYSPRSQEIGLHFEECNMFNVGIITVGDRPTQALVQITGGDFGSINRLRTTGRPDSTKEPTVGLRLHNVKSLDIDNLHTARCQIGLHARGSNFRIKQHHSMSEDAQCLVVEGTKQFPSPCMELGVMYRYTRRENVFIDPSVTGGRLALSGRMTLADADDVPGGVYAIDCQSPQMTLDVSGLFQEHRLGIKGSIHHPNPDKILGVARAILESPLVHGQIAPVKLPLDKPSRNDSPRTMNLWISLAQEGPCSLWLGPDESSLIRILGFDKGSQSLRVPPWWWFKIESAGGAKLGECARYLE